MGARMSALSLPTLQSCHIKLDCPSEESDEGLRGGTEV